MGLWGLWGYGVIRIRGIWGHGVMGGRCRHPPLSNVETTFRTQGPVRGHSASFSLEALRLPRGVHGPFSGAPRRVCCSAAPCCRQFCLGLNQNKSAIGASRGAGGHSAPCSSLRGSACALGAPELPRAPSGGCCFVAPGCEMSIANKAFLAIRAVWGSLGYMCLPGDSASARWCSRLFSGPLSDFSPARSCHPTGGSNPINL